VAYIRTIPPRQATGETAAVYRTMADLTGSGMTAKIVQMFSLRPASMRRMIRSWELSQWAGNEPRTLRELVASAVSRYNACAY
jgi:hypothetical protein